MLWKIIAVLSFINVGVVHAASKGVLVRNKTIGQLVTSNALSWESFQESEAHHLFEFAVYGAEYRVNNKDKAYICRATINQVLLTGFVKVRHNSSPKHVCIISQHKEIKTKGDFDLLLNKGNGAKLKWVPFEKMSVFQNIDGPVATINSGTKEIYYIARHKNANMTEHHEIDHAIGWFDPTDGFGRIHAIEVAEERIFEDGEILVVIEAVRYELHDMKFKQTKLRKQTERRQLGQTILKNEGDEEANIEAVIGYEYDVVRNLGQHDGIALGINTTVFVTKTEIFSFFWQIQKSDRVVNSKNVGTILQPGTAINFTLFGDYTTKEGPYDAQLTIHWADGTQSKRRKITVAAGYEADLESLHIEESATYWLHNNTVVPTTTQRTSSTSTTNKSIFSTSVSNNAIEKNTEKIQTGATESKDAMVDDTENEIPDELTSSSSSVFHYSSKLSLILLIVITITVTNVVTY